MRRFHLIELEDQPWCPPSLRDAATDYLQFALHISNAYGAARPKLQQALAQSGADTIIDLASGGGGPGRGCCRSCSSNSRTSRFS